MSGKTIYQSGPIRVSQPASQASTSRVQQAQGSRDVWRQLWGQTRPLLESGNGPAAEPLLREILRLVPSDAHAHFYLGQLEFQRRAPAAAANHLRQADEGGIGYWQTKYLLACSLWELHDYPSATQVFGLVEPAIPATEPAKKLATGIMARAMAAEVPSALWADTLRYVSEECDPTTWQAFVSNCGFHHGAPRMHNARIFENLVIPLTRLALLRDEFQVAMNLNLSCLDVIALMPHTQEQWTGCFSKTNPLFVAAGERCRDECLVPAVDAQAPPVIAIVVDPAVSGGSGLTMLMNILEQLRPARNPRVVPIVYSMQVPVPALATKCEDLGIMLVDFGALPASDFSKERLIAMRERSRRDGVTVAVYMSTYEGFVCLASSMGLAPVQIYLTMGFHSLDAPRIDAYLACGSLGRGTRRILGRPWQTLPFPFPNSFPADGSPEHSAMLAEAAAVRAELVGKTIVGTLARAEKLDHSFIEAIAEILRRNPDVIFLWFGDKAQTAVLHRITMLLDQHGIAERCIFKGWVDTKVYSHVLDVHLDCFGLPTGLTMAETFSAGTAYVLRRGTESAHIGMTAILASIIDVPADDVAMAEAKALFRVPATGEQLIMLADDTEQYIGYATRLIRDAQLRAQVGAAARRFMRKYLHDSDHMGTVFSEIIADTIAEARVRHMAQRPYGMNDADFHNAR